MQNSDAPARVRFAPSPTGSLHLGSLRTALFAWLYARHTGGQFLLRIEDTDQKRYDPKSLEDIQASLHWLGLDWDEGPDIGGPYGPYVQSKRREIYRQYADQLLAAGHAYRCYATADELAEMRKQQQANKQSPGYDRRHRNLTDEERAAFEAEARPHVVRFKAPLEGTTVVKDLIRGDIEVENALIRDPVILKGDGLPTYHLAVVVDDHLMEITHVLRGEEWISSAPLHKLLYDAFEWEMPVLVHLPVILNPNGKGKMGKRKQMVDGKEYPAMVHEFIEAGYLPEALFNFLTNMGWNFDAEREIFTPEEAIARFDVADINPAAGALPYPKLEWINGVYIRELDSAELATRLAPFISRDLGISEAELVGDPRLTALTPLIQERLKTLGEAGEKVAWAFKNADEIVYPDPKLLIGKKLDAVQSVAVLEEGSALLERIEPFDGETLEQAFRNAAESAALKPGSYFAPFRGAITGSKVSPPLFESMAVIGRDEVVQRVRNGIEALRAHAAEIV